MTQTIRRYVVLLLAAVLLGLGLFSLQSLLFPASAAAQSCPVPAGSVPHGINNVSRLIGGQTYYWRTTCTADNRYAGYWWRSAPKQREVYQSPWYNARATDGVPLVHDATPATRDPLYWNADWNWTGGRVGVGAHKGLLNPFEIHDFTVTAKFPTPGWTDRYKTRGAYLFTSRILNGECSQGATRIGAEIFCPGVPREHVNLWTGPVKTDTCFNRWNCGYHGQEPDRPAGTSPGWWGQNTDHLEKWFFEWQGFNVCTPPDTRCPRPSWRVEVEDKPYLKVENIPTRAVIEVTPREIIPIGGEERPTTIIARADTSTLKCTRRTTTRPNGTNVTVDTPNQSCPAGTTVTQLDFTMTVTPKGITKCDSRSSTSPSGCYFALGTPRKTGTANVTVTREQEVYAYRATSATGQGIEVNISSSSQVVRAPVTEQRAYSVTRYYYKTCPTCAERLWGTVGQAINPTTTSTQYTLTPTTNPPVPLTLPLAGFLPGP